MDACDLMDGRVQFPGGLTIAATIKWLVGHSFCTGNILDMDLNSSI